MNLLDYSLSDQIFIDSNVFLDYIIPSPKFDKIVSDFLDRVTLEELNAITTPGLG